MNILFVCTGNTCRSPMAEFIAKDKINKLQIKNIKIDSSGLFADSNSKMEPNVLIVLKELGIIVKTRKAKMFNPLSVKKYDYIITMTQQHKQALMGIPKVFAISDFCDFEIDDPFKQPLVIYEQTAKKLVKAIEIIFDKIINIG